MIVTFYRRIDDGDETEETIGTISMRDGRLVATPADAVALHNVLEDEIWVHRGDKPPLILRAAQHPQEFLENLQKEFGHGSYFWCVTEPVDAAKK